MVIKREKYLNQLIAARDNGLIKIITGIRRCGKSYLLFKIFYQYLISEGVNDDNIIRIPFDDWDYKDYCNPENLMEYLKSRVKNNEKYYLLFDEVQLLHNFESVLNGLLRKDNLDIYVTGSNSRFLSTDIVTEFRGRGDQIHVYPLSFSEYMSVDTRHPIDAWPDYYTYGGLPQVRLLEDDHKKIDYLHNLYASVYSVDILDRHKIKNKDEFNELVQIMASSIGSPCNPLKLSNTFKSVKKTVLGDKTIARYLTYLQDSFIIEKALRYDVKGKKYINSLSKYYFTDMGIRNALLDFRQLEETHIMENIIFNELKIRGYSVDVGSVEKREISNDGKRTRQNFEIDFVANLGSERFYIQSVFKIPSEEKMKQESAFLLNIDDSFKKIIIVKDVIKPYRNESGILILGLFDFLLNQDSLNL
ncbi:MAG: ATP-binding protein [Muribaculaceae bacterium]|nr:ATP-binding protein [Muribaculaceae bacterium]